MTTAEITNDTIQSIIAQAHGTEHWYREPLSPHLVYTDSIKALAEECGMYWFIGVVGTHMPAVLEQFKSTEDTFFTVEMKTDDEHRAVFTINYEQYNEVTDEYEEKNVAYQEIPYVDLPQCEFTLFLELADWEQQIFCLMCPGDH